MDKFSESENHGKKIIFWLYKKFAPYSTFVRLAFLFYIESFFKIIRLNCEQFVNISKKLKIFALHIIEWLL